MALADIFSTIPFVHGMDQRRAKQREEEAFVLARQRAEQQMQAQRAAQARAAQMQPLQMDLLKARLAQQQQAADAAKAKGAFFNPEELQRRGLMTPGQEAIPIPSAAVGQVGPGRPAVAPQVDMSKLIPAGVAAGVIPPMAAAQFEANQQNREATLQQREQATQMRYDLAMQSATNAATKAKLDEWFKKENLAISQARLGLERQRLNRGKTPGPRDPMHAAENEIMMKIRRGEPITKAEAAFLETKKNVGAQEQFRRQMLPSNVKIIDDQPQSTARPADYPPGAPDGLIKDEQGGFYFRVNPATGKRERWVERAGVGASGVIR